MNALIAEIKVKKRTSDYTDNTDVWLDSELMNVRWFITAVTLLSGSVAFSADAETSSQANRVELLQILDSKANVESEMKPYAEIIEQTDATIEMVPIRGGAFLMGSPDSESDRQDDEEIDAGGEIEGGGDGEGG